MAKYVIEDTTLTNTANVIREKTGGTEPITPSNFATEIASIQSGGGDTTQEDGLIDGTLTSYSNDRVIEIRSNAFLDIKTLKEINLPNVLKINSNAFKGCSNIKTFNAPKVTEIGSNSFANIYYTVSYDFPELITIGNYAFSSNDLKTINLPKASDIPYYCFESCASLESVDFPNVTTTGGSAFRYCQKLKNVNLPKLTSIGTYDFSGCFALDTIILKNETMCVLQNTNAFTTTQIASGTGYIYVPDDLVDSYKSATNWSTYANQIKPISELEASA